MFSAHKVVKCATGTFVRNFSSLKASSGLCRNRFLKVNLTDGSKRFMSGHGPDISKLQAAVYILVGGGSFAAFGMYQAKSMRNRIEAFETGKTIPFKTMTDDEFLEYKEKFRKLHSEEEEDDDDTAVAEETEQEEPEQLESEPVDSESFEEAPSKDTIIFVEAPDEE